MSVINSVAGPIDTADLGVTYTHEHIFIVNPELQHYWPGYRGWDPEKEIARARRILKALHEEDGVDSILDPTVPGIGRDIRSVAAATEGTGINVIASTGWYTYNELPMALWEMPQEKRIDKLVEMFETDVREGLDGSDIKPGAIKCATDRPGLTPHVEAVLRACARTHLDTGLPIITHTRYANDGGLMQQKVFREEGVDMGAVIIGHCNEGNDVDYMERLIDAGSFIGFDRCGFHSPVASLDDQTDNLAELCRRGHADRVVLSHDHQLFVDQIDEEGIKRRYEWDTYPYRHIKNKFIPQLLERGVTEAQIETMLIDNPRTYFSGGSAARKGGQ